MPKIDAGGGAPRADAPRLQTPPKPPAVKDVADTIAEALEGGPGLRPPGPSDAFKDGVEFAKADKNGDSKLSLEEFKKTVKPGTKPGEVIDQFGRYDANDDGKVDAAEFARGRAVDRFKDPVVPPRPRPVPPPRPILEVPPGPRPVPPRPTPEVPPGPRPAPPRPILEVPQLESPPARPQPRGTDNPAT